jgi:hypothetical protein
MATQTNYIDAIVGLMQELKKITVMTLKQSGVKDQSNLSKSIQYVTNKDGVQMLAASYYPYVSSGRKANIKRVPIADLIVWIKQYNIRPRPGQTINQLAFAIQTSIYKHGIRAKNFEEKVETGVADYTAVALADTLAVLVADDLVEAFEPVAA